MLLYSLIPLLYIGISAVWQLYVVQFIYGAAGAFAYPAWMAMFTRHVDKKHEGVEWSVYATLVEFGMAVAATIGGFVAYNYGYTALFVLASVTIFIGNISIIAIFKRLK